MAAERRSDWHLQTARSLVFVGSSGMPPGKITDVADQLHGQESK
jgi:hypothetical protein